jgi:hypothetical protein
MGLNRQSGALKTGGNAGHCSGFQWSDFRYRLIKPVAFGKMDPFYRGAAFSLTAPPFKEAPRATDSEIQETGRRLL